MLAFSIVHKTLHNHTTQGQFCVYKLSAEEVEETAIRVKENAELNKKEASRSITASGADGKKARKKSLRLGTEKFRLARFLPTQKPLEVKVLVYVVKAEDLHPCDIGGRSDPYLVVKCGRDKVVDKEHRIMNSLNPVFGRCLRGVAVLSAVVLCERLNRRF